MLSRNIAHTELPKPEKGFLGEGHIAVPVVKPSHFVQTDPFILLMDDLVDLPGTEPAGGPHPHAGFETVTLVLEGPDNPEAKGFRTGNVEWMTAGSGVVHTETITARTRMRILQLWLVLPPRDRWAPPFFQEVSALKARVHKDKDAEIRLYSGEYNGTKSPMRNHTPVTITDFRLGPGYNSFQEIPASYNGFIYVIAGEVLAGSSPTRVRKGEVAWLDRPDAPGQSRLAFEAGPEGAHFVLYAGQPQHAPIVSYGPFIGDNMEDIRRLYHDYNKGRMPHVRELPADRVLLHG